MGLGWKWKHLPTKREQYGEKTTNFSLHIDFYINKLYSGGNMILDMAVAQIVHKVFPPHNEWILYNNLKQFLLI